MEIRIDELRKERRPLWMTGLGVETAADLLGGGGDIHTDRLAADSAVGFGFEDHGEGKAAELDEKDIEMLLVGGHFTERCDC